MHSNSRMIFERSANRTSRKGLVSWRSGQTVTPRSIDRAPKSKWRVGIRWTFLGRPMSHINCASRTAFPYQMIRTMRSSPGK